MTILDISANELDGIDFAPSTTLKEIIQNVRTILTTSRGDVPLDREFGMDTGMVDQPANRVGAILTTDIVEAVERYEPRVTVMSVSFSGNGADGEIIPIVKVAINT
ncbi:GPW/gp25 family protein [Selenomonas ruminantium]|uniref:GPW/gp25 family protein n=1 Tax=Selenomonas ruminantium TaxID=971 RepID=UPI000412A936|nr:GPW/gp25 family protein [Selenomonas ruminantium]